MEAPVFEKGYPSYKAVNGKETEMKFSEFRKKFGEGTDFDLDYGKLFIIGLCIYIAVQVS
jgi:hypothetical protein